MDSLCVCKQGGERRGGCPVVWLASQGQNRYFTYHFVLGDCGEDGVVRVVAIGTWSPGMGQTASPAAPSFHGMSREAFLPQLISFFPCPFAKPAPPPLHETLAATNFSQDLGRFWPCPLPPAARARLSCPTPYRWP
jgi:hypothetical protein